MAGEGGEALLQGLFIPNVRWVNLIKPGSSTGSRAGTNKPTLAINRQAYSVFSVTVLPPVLGPVIATTRV